MEEPNGFLIKWIISEINVKTFWNRVGHWDHQLVVQTNFLNYKYYKIHRQQKQKKIKFLPHFLINMINKNEINVFEHLESGLNLTFKGFSLILCIYHFTTTHTYIITIATIFVHFSPFWAKKIYWSKQNTKKMPR